MAANSLVDVSDSMMKIIARGVEYTISYEKGNERQDTVFKSQSPSSKDIEAKTENDDKSSIDKNPSTLPSDQVKLIQMRADALFNANNTAQMMDYTSQYVNSLFDADLQKLKAEYNKQAKQKFSSYQYNKSTGLIEEVDDDEDNDEDESEDEKDVKGFSVVGIFSIIMNVRSMIRTYNSIKGIINQIKSIYYSPISVANLYTILKDPDLRDDFVGGMKSYLLSDRMIMGMADVFRDIAIIPLMGIIDSSLLAISQSISDMKTRTVIIHGLLSANRLRWKKRLGRMMFGSDWENSIKQVLKQKMTTRTGGLSKSIVVSKGRLKQLRQLIKAKQQNLSFLADEIKKAEKLNDKGRVRSLRTQQGEMQRTLNQLERQQKNVASELKAMQKQNAALVKQTKGEMKTVMKESNAAINKALKESADYKKQVKWIKGAEMLGVAADIASVGLTVWENGGSQFAKEMINGRTAGEAAESAAAFGLTKYVDEHSDEFGDKISKAIQDKAEKMRQYVLDNLIPSVDISDLSAGRYFTYQAYFESFKPSFLYRHLADKGPEMPFFVKSLIFYYFIQRAENKISNAIDDVEVNTAFIKAFKDRGYNVTMENLFIEQGQIAKVKRKVTEKKQIGFTQYFTNDDLMSTTDLRIDFSTPKKQSGKLDLTKPIDKSFIKPFILSKDNDSKVAYNDMLTFNAVVDCFVEHANDLVEREKQRTEQLTTYAARLQMIFENED